MRFEKQSSMHNRGGAARFRKGVTVVCLFPSSHNSRQPKENVPYSASLRPRGGALFYRTSLVNTIPSQPLLPIRSSSRAHASFLSPPRPSGKKLSRDFHSQRPANALSSLCPSVLLPARQECGFVSLRLALSRDTRSLFVLLFNLNLELGCSSKRS